MSDIFEKTLHFNSQEETEAFAQMLALWAKPSLLILLSGDLGSGKSTFARAFIKALATNDEPFDVPSPTFSLIQIYDNTRIPLAHVDLYRLSADAEVEALGLDEVLTSQIVLVEWPERLRRTLSGSALELNFSGTGNERTVQVKASGYWQKALTRNVLLEDFITKSKWQGATRKFFEGDASSRRYETLNMESGRTILMDMPHQPDGPPVKDGKPYSAIANLAEGITAVFAVNKHLVELGYSAPIIESIDFSAGLAIIEDLGSKVFGRMLLAGQDMSEPLRAATALLADMALQDWPVNVSLGESHSYFVRPYDVQAQLIEVDLLISWFWPYVHGQKAPQHLHGSFEDVWREILPLAKPKKPQWVLRDFHSPNLIWIPQRQGIRRVGLIDTQDAVMGHAAYDLASMLQDARVDIDDGLVGELYRHYLELRNQEIGFSATEFATAYAVLGAQRATKILGIFARLAKRDNKPSYLRHMPRVSRYLAQNLSHPALVQLKDWYEINLPQAFDVK